MQENFLQTASLESALLTSLSASRMSRYISASDGDISSALRLYDWNVRLSRCLYVRLHIWEITLRNRMNTFFRSKFGADWPYNTVFRQLNKSDLNRLTSAIARQKSQRELELPSPDMIVADLSAGFWVSMFAPRYDRMFSWSDNIQKVFPYAQGRMRGEIFKMNGKVLVLRNRIAHHEPIYKLDLPHLVDELNCITTSMCQGAAAYVEIACDFKSVLTQKPPQAI